MSILNSILFGSLFGILFKSIQVVKENKKRIGRIEDFLFGEVIAKDEVDDE